MFIDRVVVDKKMLIHDFCQLTGFPVSLVRRWIDEGLPVHEDATFALPIRFIDVPKALLWLLEREARVSRSRAQSEVDLLKARVRLLEVKMELMLQGLSKKK